MHAHVFSFFFVYARFGKNKLLPVSGAVLVPGGTGRDGVAAAAMGYRGSARTVLLMLMTRARRIEQRLVVVHVLCVLAVLLAHVPRHGLRQPLAHRCRRPAVRSCQSPPYKIQSPLLGHPILIVLPRACLSKTIVVFKNANQIIMDGSVLTEQAYGFLDRDRPARV